MDNKVSIHNCNVSLPSPMLFLHDQFLFWTYSIYPRPCALPHLGSGDREREQILAPHQNGAHGNPRCACFAARSCRRCSVDLEGTKSIGFDDPQPAAYGVWGNQLLVDIWDPWDFLLYCHEENLVTCADFLGIQHLSYDISFCCSINIGSRLIECMLRSWS